MSGFHCEIPLLPDTRFLKDGFDQAVNDVTARIREENKKLARAKERSWERTYNFGRLISTDAEVSE